MCNKLVRQKLVTFIGSNNSRKLSKAVLEILSNAKIRVTIVARTPDSQPPINEQSSFITSYHQLMCLNSRLTDFTPSRSAN